MSAPPQVIKTLAIAMAMCMGFALVFNCVAIVGPLWEDSTQVHTVHMTLWKIEVDVGGVITELTFDQWCSADYADDSTWCSKIVEARALTILTVVFSLLTTLALLIGLGDKCWVKVGCATLGLTYIFSGAALFVISWFAQNSKLTTAGYGFIMLLVGSSCVWISILIALLGICCNCCKGCSGFQSFEDGKGSQWGSYRPEPKKAPPPPMPRPVVAMPPPVPMPAPIQMPMPVPIGQKQADFGIAPAGAGPGMTPNPMSPQMAPPARPGDFGVAPPSGLMNNGMAQPQQGRTSYGQMPPQPMPQPGRSSGHDFGLDRE